jgi:hypothetical protein
MHIFRALRCAFAFIIAHRQGNTERRTSLRGKIFGSLRHFHQKRFRRRPTSGDSATKNTSPDIWSARLRDSLQRGRRREAENKESVGRSERGVCCWCADNFESRASAAAATNPGAQPALPPVSIGAQYIDRFCLASRIAYVFVDKLMK